MRYTAVFLLLILASLSFAITRTECYAEIGAKAAELHAHNAAQNPSGSIATKTYGCSGTCASQYDSCIASAEDVASRCRPDSSGRYDACFLTENTAWITCANKEIDCCVGEEHEACDAAYPPDDAAAIPHNATKENACIRELGPYAKYDTMVNGCYCPSDYTFLNTYIHQCVYNGVYSYCDERNAIYDEKTDSCICKNGYVPGGDSCVEGGTSESWGQSLGRVPDTGGASGTGNGSGSSGCGASFILLSLGSAAFFARR